MKITKPAVKRIWLSSPHMGGAEQNYVRKAFDTNWVAPLGPNVDAFENSLARYCNVNQAAALSSGTAAIHLALILLGVKAGDEVIASSFTFSATINPIVYLGATPVLIDSEPGTWNMDPELLEKAIKDKSRSEAQIPLRREQKLRNEVTNRNEVELGEAKSRKAGEKDKSIKAIIGVNLYGMPAKWKDILGIANKYNIPVIEDAAESLGSRYDGKMCGSIGKFGILSFNGNKIITTSGGGALLSDDEELITKARFLSTQARDKASHYQHSQIGYNYRMSNVLAGIGLGQMEIIDERVKQRRANFDFYKKNLNQFEGISFLEEPDNSFFSNHWLTTIIIDPVKTGKTRENLQIALEKENIESRPLWKPMHLQPVFSTCPSYLNGASEELFSKGLCLPSGSNMTDKDRNRVLEVILRFMKK